MNNALITFLMFISIAAQWVSRESSGKSLSPIQNCDRDRGATAGERIHACIQDLPPTGGTADARGIEGAQYWSADIFAGVTKPIDLWLGKTSTTISANITIPANVTLYFGNGSILSVAKDKTLTINGGFGAPLTKIFGGPGNLVITSPRMTPIYPQYWGVKGDGVADDTTGTLAAMMASRNLTWPAGVYLVDADVLQTDQQSTNWRGAGENAISSETSGITVIKARTTGTSLFRFGAPHASFEGIVFDGDQKVKNVIQLVPNASWITFTHCVFTSPAPTGISESAVVFLDGSFGGPASEVDFVEFNTCFIQGADPTHKADVGMRVSGSNTFFVSTRNSQLRHGRVLVEISGATGAGGANFYDTQFEDWTDEANYISDGPTQNLSWKHCYSETPGVFLNGSGIYAGVGTVPITIEDNQFNNIITLVLYTGQPYVLIGNDFNGNISLESTKPTGGAASYYLPPIAVGNTFGNGAHWVSTTGHMNDINEFQDYSSANLSVRGTTVENLKIGFGGSPIAGYVSSTNTIDFANTNSGASTDVTIPFASANVGDTVILTPPSVSIPGGAAGFYAWVSSPGNITYRFWNASGVPLDPPPGSFRVDLFHH